MAVMIPSHLISLPTVFFSDPSPSMKGEAGACPGPRSGVRVRKQFSVRPFVALEPVSDARDKNT